MSAMVQLVHCSNGDSYNSFCSLDYCSSSGYIAVSVLGLLVTIITSCFKLCHSFYCIVSLINYYDNTISSIWVICTSNVLLVYCV